MSTVHASATAAVVAFAVGLTVGCGAQPEAVTSTVTAESTTTVTTTEAVDSPAKTAPSASRSDCIKVPDVEGKNHQYAQDTMQAAGLYMLAEEDATGQGRMLLLDRNWEVVSQSPAAGKCVKEDTTITLRSKKIGE